MDSLGNARSDGGGAPLVVIGIPTYNRSALLRRCVASALAQSHPRIQVLISDNASTDDTQAFCSDLQRQDPRVRYLRHPVNIGPTANFNAVFAQARGDFYMWLADDDWIDPEYVERCVAVLLARPQAVVACGLAHYETTAASWQGDLLQCRQRTALARVLSYYRQVQDNGVFYGVIRLGAAAGVVVPNQIGGDWLFIAALASRGELHTVDTVLHREPGGSSATPRKLVAVLGLPAWQGRVPITCTLIVNAVADVLRAGGPYASVPLASRAALAVLLPFWLLAIKPWQEIRRRLLSRRQAAAAGAQQRLPHDGGREAGGEQRQQHGQQQPGRP